MSELNQVIEDRLAAAESSAASAASASATALTAASAAQAAADEAASKLSVSNSEPSSPILGQLWSDTGGAALKLWNGSAWVTLAAV